MNPLHRLILACLLAAPGPQTVADIAMCVDLPEAEVSPHVDAMMTAGLVAPDGAGVEITAAGEAIVRDSMNTADVPADEGSVINLAFAEVPVAGDTFLVAQQSAGFSPADAAALGAGYLELCARAAIKAQNPLLIQRGARRAKLAAALALGLASLPAAA